MKHLSVLAIMLLMLPGTVQAAEPLPAPKILVVDLDQLSEKSAATQDLAAKVNQAIDTFKQDLVFKYEALQDELRAFRVEAASMPARERGERDNAIRRRMAELDTTEREGIAEIEARGAAYMESLQDDFRDVTRTVAESFEADLVLNNATYQQLVLEGVLAEGAEDVTSIVLAFLNERVPTSGFTTEGDAP